MHNSAHINPNQHWVKCAIQFMVFKIDMRLRKSVNNKCNDLNFKLLNFNRFSQSHMIFRVMSCVTPFDDAHSSRQPCETRGQNGKSTYNVASHLTVGSYFINGCYHDPRTSSPLVQSHISPLYINMFPHLLQFPNSIYFQFLHTFSLSRRCIFFFFVYSREFL